MVGGPPRNAIRKGFVLHAQSISSIRERDDSVLGSNQTSLERFALETRLKGFAMLRDAYLDLARLGCYALCQVGNDS